MKNIFLDISSIRGQKVYIEGESYHYLKNVRRIHKGARIDAIIDYTKYSLAVTDISRRFIICDIVSRNEIKDAQGPQIRVYQAILKSKKMDLVVSKLGEMGIGDLFPLETERTVPQGGVSRGRLVRWEKLAREGAKIAGHERIMHIHTPLMLAEIEESLGSAEKQVVLFFCTEIPAPPIKRVLDSLQYVRGMVFHLVYGPEGGFSEAEVNHILNFKGIPVSLGNVLFKSETAAIVGTGFLRIYFSI